METIKTAMILALTLIHATSALATEPVCDLSITPEIVERQNTVVVHTIKGKRDNLYRPGRRFGSGLAAAALAPLFPLTFAYFMPAEGDSIASGLAEAGREDGRNSDRWYAEQSRKLTLKCHNYIRNHFPEDVIEDNGVYVVARHYSCGDVHHRTRRHRVRLGISVLYSDPVYRALDPQQIAEMKCEKVNQCMAETTTTEAYSELQEMQIQLGCQ